jgi:hypothetical protein
MSALCLEQRRDLPSSGQLYVRYEVACTAFGHLWNSASTSSYIQFGTPSGQIEIRTSLIQQNIPHQCQTQQDTICAPKE